MRKALLITTIFLLLTLTLTQLAAADFTVANDSNTKVKVIYVYFDPSQEAFRIKGYYHINPGKSKRLKVPDEVDQVVARIWTASEVVAHDRPLYWTWAVHPRKAFEVVYKHEERVVLQSNVPREELMASADFYDYANNTTFTYQPGNGSVNIFNFFLRDAITDELGKARGTKITPADMLRLQRLGYGGYSKIHVLTGLEFATNLTDLHLGGDYISDISSLTGLTNLEKLRLEVNKISDVSPLANLKNLKILWLYGNEISDLSPLAGLTNLEKLLLYGNEISDVSPLANLKNLKDLHLNQNQISDLSPLIGLTNLPYLSLQSNEISDVSPLANLKNLKGLDLRRNKISDFSPIAGLIPNLARYENSNQDVPADDAMADDGEAEDADGAEISDGAEDGGDDGPFDGAAAIVSIDPPQVAPPVGSQLTIHLKITNAQNVLGYQATVNFDPSELRYISSAYADYPSAGAFFIPIRISEGKVLFVATGTEVGAASGTLGTVTFAVVASKKPTIWLTGVELAGGDGEALAVTTRGGSPQGERPFLSEDDDSATVPLVTEEDSEDVQAAVATDAPVVGPNTAINIPDPNLRIAIEKKLGKSPGAVITVSDMDTSLLSELKVVGKNIQDLTGLEFATHLAVLHLWGNQISDISPLAELINLRNLFIYDNQISDISPLAALTNLRNLWIYGNQISDISPLAALTNLLGLLISDNQISDISPLTALTNLRNLGLYGNQISDISPLTAFTNLRWLRLSTNQISDISPLAALTNLEWLELDENQISDISPLAALTNLNNLELDSNQISDISPLTALTNLRELRLDENQISDISPLAELKNLTSLNLEGNLMSDLSPLTKLKNLIKLYLGYNHQISDYSPLLLLPRLSVVKGNGIDGIHALHAAITKTDGCTFNMPQTYGRLRPSTHVYSISRKPSQGGVSGNVGFVQSAPIVSDNATLNWTYKTTVASESEKDPTTITIEFLDGNKNEKDIVIEAARTWESFGYLHFKFLHPGQSGASDIRVKFEYNYLREVKSETKVVNGVEEIEYIPTGKTFSAAAWGTYEPPSENHGLLSFSDFRSYYGTLANELKGEATMFFTTNFGRSTALHELGHALGLTHEHLSPKFKDYFEWVDIEAVYTHFQSTQSWTREKVAGNVVNTVPVATNLPGVDFDPESVMTYGIPAKLIKARPNAPSWAKSAAINGIGSNFDLSEGDEKIMAVLYPKPRDFVVSGEITVHAMDDDLDGFPIFDDDDFYDNRDNPSLFQFEHTHHSPLVKYINKKGYIYTWGDKECRVEVHLVVRNFINNGLELGVYALLYEERAGTRGSDDLDDIACKTVRVPLYNSRKVELDLDNGGLSELQFANTRCADLYSHGEIYLGDVTGGGDWADITVAFEVDDPLVVVATSLAPSRVSVQDASSMDVNGDGQVDAADLLLVSNYIGQTGLIDPRVDVNGDGIVTIADLVLVAQHLGSLTYASAPIGVVPVGLKYSTVVGWIDQARVENDGSFAFQQGLAKLEYLLTLIIPEKTALLPNYPNPFNPETWLPYHLAEPAEVTLTIYGINGRVVRRLDLGHQDAGYYQSKSRAAYWDGRNNVGERVASGIYFYTLSVGDFSATQKLLIRK